MGPKGPGLLVVHVFKLLNSDNHRRTQSERMTDRMTEKGNIFVCVMRWNPTVQIVTDKDDLALYSF